MSRRIALIDADGIIYMVGWNFRPQEHDDPIIDSFEAKKPRIIQQVDNEIINILQVTRATHYIGAVGHPTVSCFRQDIAKFQTYKGNRKPENEVFKLWKPVIKERMMSEWGFIAVPGLEADDVVCLAAHVLKDTNAIQDGRVEQSIICSPDKDLRQISGEFYDYKKQDFADIDDRQARWLFWYQMIVGDASDNVKGVPGRGDKYAHKLLDPLFDSSNYDYEMCAATKALYLKHFGDNYGQLIFLEHEAILSMVTPNHPFYQREYLTQTMAGLREYRSIDA